MRISGWIVGYERKGKWYTRGVNGSKYIPDSVEKVTLAIPKEKARLLKGFDGVEVFEFSNPSVPNAEVTLAGELYHKFKVYEDFSGAVLEIPLEKVQGSGNLTKDPSPDEQKTECAGGEIGELARLFNLDRTDAEKVLATLMSAIEATESPREAIQRFTRLASSEIKKAFALGFLLAEAANRNGTEWERPNYIG